LNLIIIADKEDVKRILVRFLSTILCSFKDFWYWI